MRILKDLREGAEHIRVDSKGLNGTKSASVVEVRILKELEKLYKRVDVGVRMF